MVSYLPSWAGGSYGVAHCEEYRIGHTPVSHPPSIPTSFFTKLALGGGCNGGCSVILFVTLLFTASLFTASLFTAYLFTSIVAHSEQQRRVVLIELMESKTTILEHQYNKLLHTHNGI